MDTQKLSFFKLNHQAESTDDNPQMCYVPECCELVAPGQEKMPELSDRLETDFISGLLQLTIENVPS